MVARSTPNAEVAGSNPAYRFLLPLVLVNPANDDGDVVRAMVLLQAAGVESVGLVTDPPES